MTETDELFRFDEEQTAYLRESARLRTAALSPYACPYSKALRLFERRYPPYSQNPDFYLLRSPFMVDVDKILHNPFYNRCTDKTQVFAFFRNDDITRRALHLQLVSHIARTIGRGLRLNLDLIEAIALGHDMGHTPFGHTGEHMLDEISKREMDGRRFLHNVHSVRVLKTLLRCNLTLPTYDGIISHNGERDFEDRYHPGTCSTFDEFDRMMEECCTVEGRNRSLRPGTLEGCVVRISDMLAYLGKDRQDAVRAGLFDKLDYQGSGVLGTNNLSILDRTVANLVKNSMGHDYLQLDPEVARDLNRLRHENNESIYFSLEVRESTNDDALKQMMEDLFASCMDALRRDDRTHPVWTHHLSFPIGAGVGGRPTTLLDVYRDEARQLGAEPADRWAQMTIDYIASMTDDYFVDLHKHLLPDSPVQSQIHYHGYFEDQRA